jgi:hypothetical protein
VFGKKAITILSIPMMPSVGADGYSQKKMFGSGLVKVHESTNQPVVNGIGEHPAVVFGERLRSSFIGTTKIHIIEWSSIRNLGYSRFVSDIRGSFMIVSLKNSSA